MENKIGVVNPNALQQMPDVNMELFYFSLFSGVIMGILVTAVLIWIMKSAFHTRTNAASIIASFFLSGTVFMVFSTVITVLTNEIWIVSSVILWTVVFMGSLRILQPASLEQLVEKTKNDVAKLEKVYSKQKQKEAEDEAKKASKEQRKIEKARSKGVVVKHADLTQNTNCQSKDDLK